MNIRVSATIVVTAFFAITAQSADTDTCNHPSDCDHHEVPPKRGRTCRVYESQKGLTGVKVNAGTLDSPASNCQAVEFLYSVCPGYAGMSMSLWCDFEEEVAIYKDGVPLTGGTNVTYSSLQREHQGLYQCVQSVNGSNEVVGEFNMTVQSEFVNSTGLTIINHAPVHCTMLLNSQVKSILVVTKKGARHSFAIFSGERSAVDNIGHRTRLVQVTVLKILSVSSCMETSL